MKRRRHHTEMEALTTVSQTRNLLLAAVGDCDSAWAHAIENTANISALAFSGKFQFIAVQLVQNVRGLCHGQVKRGTRRLYEFLAQSTDVVSGWILFLFIALVVIGKGTLEGLETASATYTGLTASHCNIEPSVFQYNRTVFLTCLIIYGLLPSKRTVEMVFFSKNFFFFKEFQFELMCANLFLNIPVNEVLCSPMFADEKDVKSFVFFCLVSNPESLFSEVYPFTEVERFLLSKLSRIKISNREQLQVLQHMLTHKKQGTFFLQGAVGLYTGVIKSTNLSLNLNESLLRRIVSIETNVILRVFRTHLICAQRSLEAQCLASELLHLAEDNSIN